MARRDKDYYSTPAWCVEWFLDRVRLPGGIWLEPSAGSGAIVRAVNAAPFSKPDQWYLCELDSDRGMLLTREFPGAMYFPGAFLQTNFGGPCVVLGNPPYSHALEFVQVAMAIPTVDHIAYLLRLDFLASQERCGFMQRCAPDVYVLSKRPSFGGGHDMRDYAWSYWWRQPDGTFNRRSGEIRVLGPQRSLALDFANLAGELCVCGHPRDEHVVAFACAHLQSDGCECDNFRPATQLCEWCGHCSEDGDGCPCERFTPQKPQTLVTQESGISVPTKPKWSK